MGKIVETEKDRIKRLEREKLELEAENRALKAMQDYNVMMGILEDPSEEDEDDE